MERLQSCGKDTYAYMSRACFLKHKKKKETRVCLQGCSLDCWKCFLSQPAVLVGGNPLWGANPLCTCTQRAWVPPGVQRGDACTSKAACPLASALVWNLPLLAFRLMVLYSAWAQKCLSFERVHPAKGNRLLGAEEVLCTEDLTPDVAACLTFT